MVILTPGMQQYMKVKNEHPDCLILFRMGDFYETFFEDAKVVARELEITLTSRGKGESRAPLAGIPYHALDPYLAKLIKKGYKVGIVEQIEDPRFAKGLVKRDLIRIVTPGTVVESMILDNKNNNYLLSFFKDKEDFGISFCDISTGEFKTTQLSKNQFINELRRIGPAEIIFPMSLEESELIEVLKKLKFMITPYDDRFFYNEKALATLKDHFNVLSLDCFGVTSEILQNSSGALLSYIKETQKNKMEHINSLKPYRLDDSMFLDSATIRNLELLKNLISGAEDFTLLSVLDKTVTPMGKRLIRKWVVSPLTNKESINKRLDSVDELKKSIMLRSELKILLDNVYDIERLIGRVAYGNANPKDLLSLKISLRSLPKLKNYLLQVVSDKLKILLDIPDLIPACEIIERSIKEDPNTVIHEGNVIKKGYNRELDELRSMASNIKDYLVELEEKEKERTGIKSLKIRYNKVFGYFIEVTKSNLHLVPKDYIRRQTQVNGERFVTEDLKEKESKILGAQERIYELESSLFIGILSELKKYIKDIQHTSMKLADLDCLVSFAEVAHNNNYCKPILNDEGVLEITDGRHPVVESFCEISFIPNSCSLNNEERTMIITGPNMVGKSTYLRQIAIICLMAQMGSFVPATSASLPVIDRVFSRIGAYDDLVHSQSTFMVEMNETSNILNNATEKSLVLLDEIGRGTSTFDGVSLAWAITEFLNNKLKAKTLFATHYHHLNKMAELFKGINNYNMAVEETQDRIIFLRKVVKGGTDKSYGIQVAKLAGLPSEVIDTAKKVMKQIEMEDKIADNIYNHIETDKDQKDSEIIKESKEIIRNVETEAEKSDKNTLKRWLGYSA
jgi:DNA mismatch repair protein MutS